MKDFCKWLGVNDKVAKLIVWLFIGMVFLIITNILLESIGLSYYKITVDNLSNKNYGEILKFIASGLVTILNFYSVVLLVFRIKETKKIFKYSMLYLILNIIIVNIFDGAAEKIVVQLFIIIFLLTFFYFYSGRNVKYVFYGICSYITNVFVQYICYLYKLRFIDFNKLNVVDWFITSLDFLIIIFAIIFIKEIFLKRRKEVK